MKQNRAFRCLMSSAAALILESPVVVSPTANTGEVSGDSPRWPMIRLGIAMVMDSPLVIEPVAFAVTSAKKTKTTAVITADPSHEEAGYISVHVTDISVKTYDSKNRLRIRVEPLIKATLRYLKATDIVCITPLSNRCPKSNTGILMNGTDYFVVEETSDEVMAAIARANARRGG